MLNCLDVDIVVSEFGQLIVDREHYINRDEIVALSPRLLLHIHKMQLHGINERTRVHLLATHCLSRFSLS